MTKPVRTLTHYGLVRLNQSGPYLAGLQDDGRYRTSTPIVELDLEAGTAMTSSGQRYVLQGQPDVDFGLPAAVSVWGSYFDLEGAVIEPLSSEEAVALLAEQDNKPFEHTDAEKAEIARLYGVRLDDEGEVERPERVIPDPDEDEEPYPIVGIVPEVKATAILSIRDLMRQCGLSTDESAGIVGMDADRLRAIVDERTVGGVSMERLDRILEALETWAAGQGRKP